MKRRLICLWLLCAAVCLAGSALAMTEDEWAKRCVRKTSRSTTVYSVASVEQTPDENGGMDLVYHLTEAGSLPAGAYLASLGHEVDGKYEMRALVNGSLRDYYVPGDAITTAYARVHLANGVGITFPERARGDDAAIRAYLSEYHSQAEIEEVIAILHGASPEGDDEAIRDYLSEYYDPEKVEELMTSLNGASPEGSGASSAKPATAKKTAAKKAAPAVWTVTHVTDAGEKETAELTVLGSYESAVRIGGQETTVPTGSLRFGDADGAPTVIASVTTKKTGYVTLRADANASATVLGKIPDGHLAVVLAQGDEFTRVWWKGMTGYVVTKGLTLYEVGAAPIGTGVLSQKNKSQTSIFMAPEKDAKWLAKWAKGTRVTVLGERGAYYEIEKDGLRGWLKKDYVTLD